MALYAHSHADLPECEWQELAAHLRNVSRLAGGFADVFHARGWAEAAGLLHDIGKQHADFQEYLIRTAGQPRSGSSGVDHSTPGALLATRRSPHFGKLLAYAVAGHHGGLPDGASTERNIRSTLAARLSRCSFAPDIRHELGLDVVIPDRLPFAPQPERFGFQLAFFVRMLFSCLVDADFLDTEAFMAPDKGCWRGGHATLKELESRFFATYHGRYGGQPRGEVNAIRREVFDQCLAKADLAPGFFSLTVPTGGGKTLASMAFALRHAVRCGAQRVVYVIPYMSIIEQNAAVFREFLGEHDVLEHHSSFDFRLDAADAEEGGAALRAKLAAENWDAPIVATTAVQFFESLFAARPSRCRKLHNVAGSVIVLDEAQMLPRDLLRPCLEALRELVLHYGCSVVLCTATQPAVTVREAFRHGLEGVREIMADPAGLHARLRRVRVEDLTPGKEDKLDDEDLAGRLAGLRQVLCIVNTKKHARRLYERLKAMGVAGLQHLSTNMYAAHRSRKIKEIKATLEAGQPCVVCATSLVEAGVDLDFPVVYRAAAGIDSIAQAAGRCDREGQLTAAAGAPGGRVYVFTPADARDLPQGHFTVTATEGATVLRNHHDPLSPAAVEHYFKLLFWQMGDAALDKHDILSKLSATAGPGDFPFREVAHDFKLIEDAQHSVIVAIEDEAQALVRDLERADFPGGILRKLQRYTVQVRQREFEAMEKAGDVSLVADQYWRLGNDSVYADDVGICEDLFGQLEPDRLMV